jgi:hypothetical protein
LANEYKTPPVYIPVQTGLMHHTSRDRVEVNPDAKGEDRSAIKSTETPASQSVRKTDGSGDANAKNAGSDSKLDLGSKTNPANLVRAQELANREKAAAARAAEDQKHRASVASAAEMVGAPEELKRLDENRDGRIDQLEVQQALRAQAGDTTYAALSHYQKTLGFGTDSGEQAKKGDEKSDKLFAEEIAEAEEAKLLEKQAGRDPVNEDAAGGDDDSSEPGRKIDPTIKIVV